MTSLSVIDHGRAAPSNPRHDESIRATGERPSRLPVALSSPSAAVTIYGYFIGRPAHALRKEELGTRLRVISRRRLRLR